jgi:ABC-type multidrug transport system fused ATPase/permease subunit
LIERIDGDVNSLANFFSQFTLRVLGNSLLIVGILLLLFREDWRIGAGLTAYCIVMLLCAAPIISSSSKVVRSTPRER